jgi:hypothetical protein
MRRHHLFAFWHRHRRHHHHHVLAVFTVNNTSVLLVPNQRTILMTDITLGHGIDMAIAFLDQNGNAMLTTPTPDAPPTWTQSTPATESLTVDAGGMTAHTNSLAVGQDLITLGATVGGVAFQATLAVNVNAAPQVLTSIAIVPTVK